MRTSSEPRYQLIAAGLRKAIEQGTLRAGERLPSLRQMSVQHRASVSTIVQAFSLLEDSGFIEGRDRSGFFVRPQLKQLAKPRRARHPNVPVEVSSEDLHQQMMALMDEPGVVPWGAATLGDEFLPLAELARATRKVLRSQPSRAMRYSPAPGAPELRREIARHLLERGLEAEPDEIVLTNGAMEGLQLALRAVTKPGDVVAVEAPTYFGLLHCIHLLGLKAIEVPCDADEGMCPDALETSLASHRVAAIVIQSSVSNPLGATLSDQRGRRVLALAEAAGAVVIDDDVYSELQFREPLPRPYKCFDPDDRMIACGSFSKSVAPGLRIGWVHSGRHARQLGMLKLASTLSNSALAELTLAEFMGEGGFHRHLRRIRRELEQQVMTMRQGVLTHLPIGTRASIPRGGFLLWVELPPPLDGIQLLREAVPQGVCFVPGSLFSATGRRFSNCIRINCGHDWDERQQQALQVLGKLASRQLEG